MKNQSITSNLDWISVAIYIILVILGWLNIYSSSLSSSVEDASLFDFSQIYGKQMLFIFFTIPLVFIILAIDGKFYEKYTRDFGHDFALHIANVPGFEWILFHIGNTTKDTRGCLLVNRNIGVGASPRDYVGSDSTSVYKLLYALVKAAFERGEEVWVDVTRRDIIDENTPVG